MTKPNGTAAVERVTAFTDATVAIALTLLVLPLIEHANAATGESVWQVLADSSGDLFGFLVSFLVIAQFWAGHRRLFAQLVNVDERLLAFNVAWLVFVVFLPYPTALLFLGSVLADDASTLYLATLLTIALIGIAQTWYVMRHPELHNQPDTGWWRDKLAAGAGTVAVLVIAFVVSFVAEGAALLILVLLGGAATLAQSLDRRRRTT